MASFKGSRRPGLLPGFLRRVTIAEVSLGAYIRIRMGCCFRGTGGRGVGG